MLGLENVFAPGILRRIPCYAVFLLSIVNFGVDSGITGSIQASTQWQTFFGNPTGSTLGILNSISTLGLFAGNLIAPYITDGLGRKYGVLVGVFILFFATALQAGAQNVSMYLAARFFVGLGIIAGHNASPAYLAEFSPAKERSVILGFYSPFYFIGAIVISWTCYSTVNWDSDWSWRGPSLVQLCPALIQLILLPFVPESPRWLVLHGKPEEARAVLIKYHGSGVETEQVKLEYATIVENSAMQKRDDDSSRWTDLWSTKGRRIRLFIAVFAGLSSQWSGNGLISYYIVTILKSVGITDPKSQTLFNGMLSVWSFIYTIGMAPCSQRFGRRPIFLIGIGGMIAVWSCFTGLSAGYAQTGNAGMASGVLAMIFLFNTVYGMAWTTLFMYPTELWESGLRAKALAGQNSLDYVGLFFNIYVNPIAMDAIAWKYYIIYIVILVAQFVAAYLTFIETNGLSVEVICEYFKLPDVKWFAGPTSKQLLIDFNEKTLARIDAERMNGAGEKHAESLSEKSDGAHHDVLPAV